MFPRATCALAALALLFPVAAHARGGDYVIVGGTNAQRAAVVGALEASSFDWDRVPRRVTIYLQRGTDSRALPGAIWLDADLLDAGRFAWGVVQHEYAHQVHYLLLDDAARATMLAAVGGHEWCSAAPTQPHAHYGCERFAAALAWAYWTSAENCMKPAPGEAALTAAQFRELLEGLLRNPARGHLRSSSNRSRSPARSA